MKKLLTLFIILIGTCVVIKAQGNLQFSQVVRYKYSTSATGQGSVGVTSTFTVPANTVWKIESVYGGGNNVFLDGQLVTTTTTNSGIAGFPLWLGAGTYQIAINNGNQNLGTYSYSAIVSGLQFNIVP